ncbi:MAG TPA: sigma-70 family RNA polymerase sigma factor [Anaerolineales bacterium]|nr:sigma-70 family RNA polymerase sigma factor [Anaerolineales bacterium]
MSKYTTPSIADEKGWVDQASRGDLNAFNQLVLKYQDMVYNHAYALLGDGDTAEDAAQEAFLHAFQSMSSFRGGSFRAWLLRITTNASYDLLRRARRRPTQPLFPRDDEGDEVESPAWLADPTTLVEKTVEQKEASQRLQQIIDELPENYRSVIMLIDVQEIDYVEAAHILKLPLGTVKSRLARARFQLQKMRLRGADFRRANWIPCAAGVSLATDTTCE